MTLLFIFVIGKGLSPPAFAQSDSWHLTRFTTINGLAASDISTSFQDSRHFLWIGHAAGISTFDGYNFENLLFGNNQRIGKVNAIVEDNKQIVWIGAEGGLFYYKENKLFHAGPDSANSSVYALAFAKDGSLWIGTDNGPAILSRDIVQRLALQKQNSTYSILTGWMNSHPVNKRVKFISIAGDGAVYITNGYTVYRYHGNKLVPVYTVVNKRDYITGIVGFNKDTVYVSSQLSGFWMIGQNKIQRYSFSSGIGNALTSHADQLLYFASEGVYSFNPRTNAVGYKIEMPKQYQEWGSCVALDNENNTWIGTHEELLYVRPLVFHSIYQPGLEGFNELYSLYKDPNGSLMTGGNRGRVFKNNGDSRSFSLWKTVFPLAEVFDIHKENRGDTWFCSGYEGLSLLSNGNLKRFTTADGLRSNGNYKFLSTTNNELFACGENGITKIIYGDRIYFKNYYTSTDSNYTTIVTDGIANADGSLLLGSDRGLLEWKNDSLYSLPIKNSKREKLSITGIRKDKAGNIWVSTIGDGILLCAKNENNWILKKQFNTSNGLSSMIYLQLLIDNKDVIWAVGYSGITRIEPKEENTFFIKSYNQSHGFTANSFHSVRMIQDDKGFIWIATSSGVMNFDPQKISHSYYKPVCSITSISFPDKNMNTGFAMPVDLQLPYGSRSLSFHFTGIHLSNSSALQYAYRLMGADSNWVNIGQERSVNLQNLAPGNYIFQVRATTDNTSWGNTESYLFKVLSPFWQRWWFILLSSFCLSSSVIFFIKRREKNIKKREGEKTELQQFKATSLQYQLEIEQIINFFATSMNEQRSIEGMLWDVTKNCISQLGFEDCVIYLKDEKRNVLLQKAAWGAKTTEDNKITNPIEIPLGRGIVGSVALSGNPEIVADTSVDSRYIVDDVRRGSEISVPIIDDKKIIGVIDSEHDQKNFYTERHLQVLGTIASLIADKIDKIKAEQQTREKEMEVLKLNKDLAISQLTALRAQMNPHFIFNALNSVQQYILQGNVIEANKYLSKFSRLQREILNHCDQNFILLEKETEMLDLYLQLEQLRFNELFSYNIQLDDAIDSREIKIPPMMLQPFVENAIWHGLMPKQDKRKVDIKFDLTQDDILVCTIRDNGIGREAASRLQQASGNGNQHKSKGLSLVYERMNILRQQYQQPFEVIITDLTDQQGNPQGTLVTLTIFAGH